MGEGVLDISGLNIKSIPIPKINMLSESSIKKLQIAFENIRFRKIDSIFNEIGINRKISIRDQKPNPLPDRKALDDIVFDILELTEEE